MKTISYWAKLHPVQTRILIVVIYIVLFGLGISTGRLLNEVDVTLPGLYLPICCVVLMGLWMGYPVKNTRGYYSATYACRKFFDFFVGAITFLMVLYAGNNPQYPIIGQEAMATRVVPNVKDPALMNHPLLKDFITSINGMDAAKLSEREKIKIIKKQIRKIQNDTGTSKGEKTGLIILSILVALALLLGLTALSCNLWCAGSGALAAIVAMAGTFLIIFFLIKIIKSIKNPKPKKQPEEIKPPGTL